MNVLFTAWIVLGASLEERDLLTELGKDYACYRQEVPMFVPGLRTRRTRDDKTKAYTP